FELRGVALAVRGGRLGVVLVPALMLPAHVGRAQRSRVAAGLGTDRAAELLRAEIAEGAAGDRCHLLQRLRPDRDVRSQPLDELPGERLRLDGDHDAARRADAGLGAPVDAPAAQTAAEPPHARLRSASATRRRTACTNSPSRSCARTSVVSM